MAKRPLAILLASLLFLYFPLELGARWLNHLEVDWADIVISAGLPLLVLIGLIRVTRIGWYTLIAFIALWGLHDLFLFYQAQHNGLGPLFMHLGIYVMSLSYFINPRVRTLYFDPKLCWWKSKPRYETNLPLLVNDGKQWVYPILRNVSEGGCFVETHHPMDLNTLITLAIPLPIPLAVSVIRSQGEVKWVSRNPLRPGMGIQFTNPTRPHQQALKQYVRNQL